MRLLHAAPTKADYLSVRGLAIIERYRDLAPGRRFARNLGVVINQKDGRIRAEEEWHQWLLADAKNACFRNAIPRRAYIQRAADFDPGMRTYAAKYPGDAGEAIRALSREVLDRLDQAEAAEAAGERKTDGAVPAVPAVTATEPAAGPADAQTKPAVPEATALVVVPPPVASPAVEPPGSPPV